MEAGGGKRGKAREGGKEGAADQTPSPGGSQGGLEHPKCSNYERSEVFASATTK